MSARKRVRKTEAGKAGGNKNKAATVEDQLAGFGHELTHRLLTVRVDSDIWLAEDGLA